MKTKICKCGYNEFDHDRIYCKYCGSRLKKDKVGFYCKTNYCTWFNGGPCKKFEPVDSGQTEKGCGKKFMYDTNTDMVCGEFNPTDKKIELCPKCKPKNHSQQENSEEKSFEVNHLPAGTDNLSGKIFPLEYDTMRFLLGRELVFAKDIKKSIKKLLKRNTITHQITVNDVKEIFGPELTKDD